MIGKYPIGNLKIKLKAVLKLFLIGILMLGRK
jgi:hypothetical protein